MFKFYTTEKNYLFHICKLESKMLKIKKEGGYESEEKIYLHGNSGKLND